MKPLRVAIRERVLRRAEEVLKRAGHWPAARAAVPVDAIVDRLARSLPGDIGDYEIDHVMPLKAFDLRHTTEVRKAFAADNHRWLRRGANRRRGAAEAKP